MSTLPLARRARRRHTGGSPAATPADGRTPSPAAAPTPVVDDDPTLAPAAVADATPSTPTTPSDGDPALTPAVDGHRLNWLRAAVLGANDGIVSVAGLVVAVAGATTDIAPLMTAGIAGLVAGAGSMALGEYVSVNSQRDAQSSQLSALRRRLSARGGRDVEGLAEVFREQGLRPETAHQVAVELTRSDPVTAHARARLDLDPQAMVNAWHAAFASAAAFLLGGIIPLLAILLPPPSLRVPVAFVGVLLALAVTGAVSARLGHAPVRRAVVRVVVGGALGLSVTYGIGWLFGVAVG